MSDPGFLAPDVVSPEELRQIKLRNTIKQSSAALQALPSDELTTPTGGFTPENWLSPATPGRVYGNILPYSFEPIPIPYKDAGKPQPGSVQWAVPNLIRGAVNDLALTLAAPRNAALGKYTPEEMKNKLALPMTSTLMGAGLGMPAPAGSARIFAGLNARTAPTELLDAATLAYEADLKKFGGARPATVKKVFSDTGWYQDKDGNWKFEIPDVGQAKLKGGKEGEYIPLDSKEKVQLPDTWGTKLGDVLEHPRLFEAYPWLKDLPVKGMSGEEGVLGQYHPRLQAISLAAATPEALRSTMLHEVQHAVQHREGFAFGGDLQQFLPSNFYQIKKLNLARLEELAEEAEKVTGKKGNYAAALTRYLRDQAKPGEAEAIETLIRKAPDLYDTLAEHTNQQYLMWNQEMGAWNKYQGIAGEVEARNVQERLAQGDTWSHPHYTTGYFPGEQTLVFPGDWEAKSFVGWHGTPHEFEPVEGNPFGAFRDDKIGTGEGAQVYGHGHYVAGVPETAQEYKEQLGKSKMFIGNKELPRDDFFHGYLMPYINDSDSLEDAIKASKQHAREQEIEFADAKQRYALSEITPEQYASAELAMDEARRAADTLSHPDFRVEEGGHLLKTVVTPEEEELLHWDKPFAEQSPGVQSKLRDSGLLHTVLDDSQVLNLKDNPGWKPGGQPGWRILDVPNPNGAGQIMFAHHPESGQTIAMGHSGGLEEKFPSLEAAESGVRKALGFDDTLSGEDIYSRLSYHLGRKIQKMDSYQRKQEGKRRASEELAKAGIPGIRYYDQLSRDVRPELHFEDTKAVDRFEHSYMDYNKEGHWKTIFDYTPEELAHSVLTENAGGVNTPEKLARALEDTDHLLTHAVEMTRSEMDPFSSYYVENLHPDTLKHRIAARDWFKANKHKYEVKTPKQTHNYVIFDPKHIKIVGKNGKLLPQAEDDPFDVGGWPW